MVYVPSHGSIFAFDFGKRREPGERGGASVVAGHPHRVRRPGGVPRVQRAKLRSRARARGRRVLLRHVHLHAADHLVQVQGARGCARDWRGEGDDRVRGAHRVGVHDPLRGALG